MSTRDTNGRFKKETPLQRIERKLDELIAAQGQGVTVDVADLPPLPEPWVPKAGDWVVCDGLSSETTHVWPIDMRKLIGMPMSVEVSNESVVYAGGLGLSWGWKPEWLRPATPEEIKTYQEKEQEKEREQKKAKLKFGTWVDTPKGRAIYLEDLTGEYVFVALERDPSRYWFSLDTITIIEQP
jgi:hypothetical protein